MNIIQVLIFVAVTSFVQAIEQTKMSKPKLLISLVQSQNLSSEKTKHKSPEERRKLSIFPKNNKKFVVSTEPYYKPITHKSIVTKKPLMRKIILQNEKPNLMNIPVENETRKPILNTQYLYQNKLAEQAVPNVISEEISIEIIEEKSEESYEKKNDDKEIITTTSRSANMDYFNVKDFMFPLFKPAEVSSKNKSVERFFDSVDAIKHSEEDEVPDLEEYIFLDTVQKPMDSENVSNEVTEEFITTETSIEPKKFRRKRSSNIIVEENLGTTMAGYKYTWKNTRLTNHLAFKNINS